MNKEMLKSWRKVRRDQQLQAEQQEGRQRSNSWGGKPSSRDDRRQTKNKLRNGNWD